MKYIQINKNLSMFISNMSSKMSLITVIALIILTTQSLHFSNHKLSIHEA